MKLVYIPGTWLLDINGDGVLSERLRALGVAVVGDYSGYAERNEEVIRRCDAMVLPGDYYKSSLALIELQFANKLGMDIFHVGEWPDIVKWAADEPSLTP